MAICLLFSNISMSFLQSAISLHVHAHQFPPKLHIHLSEQKFKLNLAHLQNVHCFTKMSFKIRYFWGAR